MSSVKTLNAKAEVLGRGAALFMNINAAKGLYDVMKSNLGPKGTIKMLVGGSGGQFIENALSQNNTFNIVLYIAERFFSGGLLTIYHVGMFEHPQTSS